MVNVAGPGTIPGQKKIPAAQPAAGIFIAGDV
jgi:hypothetical protein